MDSDEERKKEKSFLFAAIQERGKNIFFFLLFLTALFCSIYASIKCWSGADNKPAERIFFLLLSAFCSFTTGILFIKLYLPGIIEFFTDSLLAPKKHLQKAPPLLSLPRNLMGQKRFPEAEILLTEYLREYPCDPALTHALAELYALHMPDPEKMELLCQNYFANGPVITAKVNITILLLYTDQLIRQGRKEDAAIFLRQETAKKIYLPDELNSIHKRLSALER